MTHDEVRKRATDDGIQFFLAQFVEMHGKPNAKAKRRPGVVLTTGDTWDAALRKAKATAQKLRFRDASVSHPR